MTWYAIALIGPMSGGSHWSCCGRSLSLVLQKAQVTSPTFKLGDRALHLLREAPVGRSAALAGPTIPLARLRVDATAAAAAADRLPCRVVWCRVVDRRARQDTQGTTKINQSRLDRARRKDTKADVFVSDGQPVAVRSTAGAR